jgi:hypothetical protein
MRAKEFIVENNYNDGEALEISRAMPATYAISKLPNSDFYKQYRFGVAIASARSEEARRNEPAPTMAPSSIWGENEIVVSYDSTTADVIDAALKIVGLAPKDKKLISTAKSEEMLTVNHQSPVRGFKGYER